jgi:hypothetical protein
MDGVSITSGVQAAKRRTIRIFGRQEHGLRKQASVAVVSGSDVDGGTDSDETDDEDTTESEEESDEGNENGSKLNELVELLQLQLNGLQLQFQKKSRQDRAKTDVATTAEPDMEADEAIPLDGMVFSAHASVESAQLEHYLRDHGGDDSMSVVLSFPKQGTKSTPEPPRCSKNPDIRSGSIGDNCGQKKAKKCLEFNCVWVKPAVALQILASPKPWSAQQQLGVPVDMRSDIRHRRAPLLRAGYLHKLSVDIEPAEVQLEDHTVVVLGKGLLPALERLKVQQQLHKQEAYELKCGISQSLAELQQQLASVKQPAASTMYDMMHMILVDDTGGGGLSTAAYRSLQSSVSPHLYIERMDLGSMALFVTMRMAKRVSRKQSNNNECLYVSSDRTPVRLSAVTSRRCMLGNQAALAKELAANYAADALLSSPALLGSLDLLGNPTGLLREYAIGMKDLVLLPLQAVREGRGVGGLLRGVRDGSSSLVRHVVGGTLTSVAGFSASVARNLGAVGLELGGSL